MPHVWCIVCGAETMHVLRSDFILTCRHCLRDEFCDGRGPRKMLVYQDNVALLVDDTNQRKFQLKR